MNEVKGTDGLTASQRWGRMCSALNCAPDNLELPIAKAHTLQENLRMCRKSHADLLEACKALVRHCNDGRWVGQDKRDKVCRDLTAAESLIQKAL